MRGRNCVPFLGEGPKEYEVTLQLGEETDTGDADRSGHPDNNPGREFNRKR